MRNAASGDKPNGKYVAGLSLAATGVVFGDIGTSPLYTFSECFHPAHGIEPTAANVLGILSLILWSLILVVSIKYVIFIFRADINGEGGVLVLTKIISSLGEKSKKTGYLVVIGLFGAALLYGDSTITPAITVLSAVEGLEVATSFFEPYIIPVATGILVALFILQRRGTANIGNLFGPVMILWFLTIAALGISQIVQAPQVLAAINPVHGLNFFMRNGLAGFLVLGSVVLAVTGCEVLYADIGHFGRVPIRMAWYGLVFPSLLLCYFGQGALLLQNPKASVNPFFHMAPDWLLYPLVAIATAAAIIASQAVITGAFSLTRQAMQFGYFPRMEVVQTSSRESGQIYMRNINWTMMIITVGLVLGFQTSGNLAAAYGMAVTSTMLITTVIFSVLIYKKWKWNVFAVIPFVAFFLIIDLSFFSANITKIPDGGWIPLVIAGIVITILLTWENGRSVLKERTISNQLPLEEFMENLESYIDVEECKISYVEGTALYLYSNPDGTPPALLYNIKHNRVIHKNVVLINVKTSYEYPYIRGDKQVEVESLGKGLYRIILHCGFAQGVNVPQLLNKVDEPDLELDSGQATYFLSNVRIIASAEKNSGMATWRDHLFRMMYRNQLDATAHFGLPSDRVIEVGGELKF